jgi:hypothetical protein
MEGWFSRARKGDMIDGGSFLSKKATHFFQNFFYRNIFFSYKSFIRGVSNLAVDTVVGANFMGNEVNPERSPQSSGRNGTIKIFKVLHGKNRPYIRFVTLGGTDSVE